MTIELQNRLLVLYAILLNNGKASKKQVLDYLETRELIILTENDISILKSRNEMKWRNELAFIRQHLVEDNYLDNKERNFWTITDIGIEYYQQLKSEIITEEGNDYQRLSGNFIHLLNYDAEFMDSVESDELFQDNKELKNETVEKKIQAIRRYRELIDKIKGKYDSKCQIKGCGYTFPKKNGENYSEGHHLIPLSQGGKQYDANVVVLCANHHRMFHYADIKIEDKIESRRTVYLNNEEYIIEYK